MATDKMKSMRSDDRDLDDDTVVALFEHLFDVPEWMTTGECVRRGLDPKDTDSVLLACRACPVTVQCAELAEDLSLTTGVYGGVDLSKKEV